MKDGMWREVGGLGAYAYTWRRGSQFVETVEAMAGGGHLALATFLLVDTNLPFMGVGGGVSWRARDFHF